MIYVCLFFSLLFAAYFAHKAYRLEKKSKQLKRANRKMEKISIKVESKRNDYKNIFQALESGVISISPTLKVTHINSRASEILNCAEYSDEDDNRPDIYLLVRYPQVTNLIKWVFKESKSIEKEVQFFDEVKPVTLNVYVKPMFDAKQRLNRIVVIIEDRTELRKLEKYREEFVQNVSHELRTPLTNIQGYCETLMSGQVGEKDQKDFLNIIFEHSTRLGYLIDDILSLSQMENDDGSNKIRLEEVFLSPVITSCIKLCKAKVHSSEVQFEANCPEEIKLKINKSLFTQALVNLLENAVKYSEEAPVVRVQAKTIDSNQYVKISVIDGGPGIAPEHLPRLFERFYRVDKARNRKLGGTGLGLSIVKHIAQVHGGSVEVRSELGQGSEFSLILPSL